MANLRFRKTAILNNIMLYNCDLLARDDGAYGETQVCARQNTVQSCLCISCPMMTYRRPFRGLGLGYVLFHGWSHLEGYYWCCADRDP